MVFNKELEKAMNDILALPEYQWGDVTPVAESMVGSDQPPGFVTTHLTCTKCGRQSTLPIFSASPRQISDWHEEHDPHIQEIRQRYAHQTRKR